MRIRFALTALFLLLISSHQVYAQNFSFGVDLPLVGGVDNSDSQLAVGAGLSVGLVHAGPVRVGIGFGAVAYPNRKPVKIFNSQGSVLEEFKDRSDLVFTISTGFRIRKVGYGAPAVYFNVSYMRAVTAKAFPGVGKISSGLLMGLTYSSG